MTGVTIEELRYNSIVTTHVATAAATATLIVTTALANRKQVIIRNNNAAGGATVFIGGDATVTNLAAHFSVPPQTSQPINAGPNCLIYYYSVAGGDDLDIMECA